MKEKFTSVEELMEWIEEHSPNINYVHVEWDDKEPLHEGEITSTTISSGDGTILTSDGTLSSGDTIIFTEANTTGCTIQPPEIEVLSPSIPSTKLSVIPSIVEGQNKDMDNIWYVESYECMPDTCMTGKIRYNDNTYFMNICESDGAKVELPIRIDGTPTVREFKLKTCNIDNEYDMILYI